MGVTARKEGVVKKIGTLRAPLFPSPILKCLAYTFALATPLHCTGVQTRVREFAPYATYIHCYAHVLNFVLVDSVKSIKSASEFFTLLEALYVFVSSSKIHVLFMDKQR